MSAPTNSYKTYDIVGQREGLTNIITNIAPTATPFQSNIGRTKATSVLHEFQTDTLAPASSNAVIEGDDSVAGAQVPTVRLSNRTQISKKVVNVSGTANATVKAGRTNKELSTMLAKAGKELKLDMEIDLCGKNVAVAGNASTARKLRGYESWVTSNINSGSGGATNASTGVVTDGTQRVLTEVLLKDVLQKCWTAGGDPDCVMVNSFQKQKISGFTGIATLHRPVTGNGQASIMGAADLYISDFGEIKVVPSRLVRDRTALIIEKDKWAVAYLRPFKQEKLAKTGDSDMVHMLVEYTLEAKQEASSGKIADLTTA